VASIWLLPVHFNVMLPPPTLNASQVALIIQQISSATGAEVVFKSNNFEMHGVEHEVRAAVAMVLELDIIKVTNVILIGVLWLNTTLIGIPSRDSLPNRTGERTQRVHQREKEREDEQNHANHQCQDQVRDIQ
jgi:hypothetical protein